MKYLSAHAVLAVLAVLVVLGLIVFGITHTTVSSLYQAITYAILGAFISVNGGKAISQTSSSTSKTSSNGNVIAGS